jgi:hypothetical protein
MATAKGQKGGRSEEDRSSLDNIRELFTRSVVLPSDRLRETLEDAVRRGRITRDDADELIDRLVSLGRAQTEDTLARLDRLMGPGKTAARGARTAVRKAVGSGSSGFPISGYDDLTAAQVINRLQDLEAAELRQVREHEKRNANRKMVLAAIDKRLR